MQLCSSVRKICSKYWTLSVLSFIHLKEILPKELWAKGYFVKKGNLTQRKFVPMEICPTGNLTQRKFDPKESWPNGNLSNRKSYPKEIWPNGNLSNRKCYPKEIWHNGNLSNRKSYPKEIWPKGKLTQEKLGPKENLGKPIQFLSHKKCLCCPPWTVYWK